MKIRLLICVIYILIHHISFGQNKIDLKAVFDVKNKQINIHQTIEYQNDSHDTLQSIYLNDWSHSFSSKKTPLAERLAEEYKNEFHLAKDHDRGFTKINSITQNGENLVFSRLKGQIDVLKVKLSEPLKSGDSYTIQLEYTVQVASNKFTSYGLTKSGDFNLRYWYITPAIYNGDWQYYSNKDLDDLYIPKANVSLEVEYPNDYTLTSELDLIESSQTNDKHSVKLYGEDRIDSKLFLNKSSDFNTIQTGDFSIVSNIDDGKKIGDKKKIQVLEKVLITEKITKFILDNFGEYPHKRLVLSKIDYGKDPVYGLNKLPDFLQPYPKHFRYELKILKMTLRNYLENTFLINPRKEQWLIDGILIYYLMNYVDEHYPDIKFLGTYANFWGVRSFHAADMKFNDKYTLAFMLMARTNKDQVLTMPKDSLLKFNKNIANKYKGGLGLKYLDDFVNNDIVENSIEVFLRDKKLKQTSTKEFEQFIKSKTDKNIDWFFTDYLSTRKKVDFKIKKVIKTDDSITLTIKNKRDNSMPVSLYTLNNDSIISKTWIENIKESKTLTVPKNSANKLVLNYNKVIPEINLRDNWKSLRGFLFNNKPLQFRLFQDIEDPDYNQVFFMPIAEYNNIYDGITLGVKAYNKTVLKKLFNYKIQPKYALQSKSLTGSFSSWMTHYFENQNLYSINYGVGGGLRSYAEDLFVRQLTPSLTFRFREDNDFRSNKRRLLTFRYFDINRDIDLNSPETTTDPNYSVFNVRYINSNDNLIHFSKWNTDLQISKTFSKASFTYEYRRLFESNRQLNLRFYAGTFLSNNNDADSNYFNFALDRPTDYLFEYSYLGRSENSGIFSQEYITAEGGFKSKLDTPFANQWITTLNASTTIWNYVLLYGDVGFVKNKFNSSKFVYDSGIRFNLVTDYFEIYLPLYSNLGWEMGLPNYDERIRFKFTADPGVLLELFRRRWF